MTLTVAGVGPGDPELVTVGALKAIADADLVLAPCSKRGKKSVAEEIILAHLPELKTVPFVFPMTSDVSERDRVLRDQLAELGGWLGNAESVVLPVIGDSTLYATGSYLFDIWRELVPDIKLRLIPGVSAHALAASRAGSFLAMGEEILTIIPCTAGADSVGRALRTADVAAIYKTSALDDGLRLIAGPSGPWNKIVRVDRAGLPDENIILGEEALEHSDEYLSITLLWR